MPRTNESETSLRVLIIVGAGLLLVGYGAGSFQAQTELTSHYEHRIETLRQSLYECQSDLDSCRHPSPKEPTPKEQVFPHKQEIMNKS